MSPLHRCAGQGPGVREVAQCPKEAGDIRRHWADLQLLRPHSVPKALDPRSGACPGSCFSGGWTDFQLCARQQVTLCLYLFFFFSPGPCLGIRQDPSSCPAPRASRVSHQETVGCRFRAGLGDTAASSRIHLPRFGAWPGPDLTGGQAGHLATPSHPPSSSGRFWAGAGTPDEHTRERGWGQYSAGSWIQSLN